MQENEPERLREALRTAVRDLPPRDIRPEGLDAAVRNTLAIKSNDMLREGFSFWLGSDAEFRFWRPPKTSSPGHSSERETPDLFRFMVEWGPLDLTGYTRSNLKDILQTFIGVKPASAKLFQSRDQEETEGIKPLLDFLVGLDSNITYELVDSKKAGDELRFHYNIANECPIVDVRMSLPRSEGKSLLALLKNSLRNSDDVSEWILEGAGRRNAVAFYEQFRINPGDDRVYELELKRIKSSKPMPEELLYTPDRSILNSEDPHLLAAGRASKVLLAAIDPCIAEMVAAERRTQYSFTTNPELFLQRDGSGALAVADGYGKERLADAAKRVGFTEILDANGEADLRKLYRFIQKRNDSAPIPDLNAQKPKKIKATR